MAGSRRSKRVSWAAGANLCKVRLFLSEDSPSQAGLGAQDNLQAKGSWLLHAAGPGSDDSLPPGFESLQPANNFKIDISQIPLIKWRYPPNIMLNPDWCVVAGEESEEIAVQNERMFGALEAIYPRPSNIPPNPFVSSDVQDSQYDDSQTPLVPLTPVEDEDASDQLEAPPLNAPANFPLSDMYVPAEIRMPQISPIPSSQQQPQPQHYCSGAPVAALPLRDKPAIAGLSAEPDVLAAASAAFTAIMRSNEEGSMIDRDLLIKILSDPAQIERLLTEYGATKQAQSVTTSVAVPMPPPRMTVGAPTSFSEPMATFHSMNPSVAAPATLPPPPPPIANRVPSSIPSVPMIPPPSMNPPLKDMNFANAPMKDMNYYKSLVQQHGGEKQEALDQYAVQFGNYQNRSTKMGDMDVVNNGSMVQRDAKPKIMKPCAYFNSPKGCRNGSGCLFLHDSSAPRRKEQPKGSKRIKLDNRIVGRN